MATPPCVGAPRRKSGRRIWVPVVSGLHVGFRLPEVLRTIPILVPYRFASGIKPSSRQRHKEE